MFALSPQPLHFTLTTRSYPLIKATSTRFPKVTHVSKPGQPLRQLNPIPDKEKTRQTMMMTLSERSTISALRTNQMSLPYRTLFEAPYIFHTIYSQNQQQQYLLFAEGLHLNEHNEGKTHTFIDKRASGFDQG